MPRFNFTRNQLEALKTLEWLYDTGENYRREGRSTILAFYYLQQIFIRRNENDPWVIVRDHYPRHELDGMLARVIIQMAADLGMRAEFSRTRKAVRLSADQPQLPWAIIERDLFEIGTSPNLPETPLYESEPNTTLWEHLTDSSTEP